LWGKHGKHEPCHGFRGSRAGTALALCCMLNGRKSPPPPVRPFLKVGGPCPGFMTPLCPSNRACHPFHPHPTSSPFYVT
jgi:hypothetical protein